MVPMLTCGLLRSNFAFATAALLRTLLLRHATSGTDCGRQGVGGWIWTGLYFDPGPVTAGAGPHHPDCGGYGWPRIGANPYRSVSFSCAIRLARPALARRCFPVLVANQTREFRASVARAPSRR